jgi:hypothetical protein
MNLTQKKLYIDLGVFLLFSIASAPQSTGLAFHEWISLAFIPVIIIHVFMSWRWIVSTTVRVFKRLPGNTRFNHIWDALLFITMTNVIFSGIVVSEVALPKMGIPIVADAFWIQVHEFTSKWFLVLLGIHLAMHWDWIANAWKRYVLRGSPGRMPVNVEGSQI